MGAAVARHEVDDLSGSNQVGEVVEHENQPWRDVLPFLFRREPEDFVDPGESLFIKGTVRPEDVDGCLLSVVCVFDVDLPVTHEEVTTISPLSTSQGGKQKKHQRED